MMMETKPFDSLAIVGAGTMGAQIGLLCALHGYDVWLVDSCEEALQRTAQSHLRDLEVWAAAEAQEAILSRLHYTSNMAEGVSHVGLVIEAVPERLEAKREVFAQLDGLCPKGAILATNSSSIRISLIESATHRPDRVLNLHFYAPIVEKPMVDLMRGSATSDATMERMRRFAQSIGMTPLMVRKESTGFVFNRVWRAVKKECLHLVDEGVASHEDVDRAWMVYTGMKMGPFGQMDLIGLDVVRDIEMVYYGESGDASDLPPRLLLDRIARGELGVKSRRGFYTYPHPAFQDPEWLKGEDGPAIRIPQETSRAQAG